MYTERVISTACRNTHLNQHCICMHVCLSNCVFPQYFHPVSVSQFLVLLAMCTFPLWTLGSQMYTYMYMYIHPVHGSVNTGVVAVVEWFLPTFFPYLLTP